MEEAEVNTSKRITNFSILIFIQISTLVPFIIITKIHRGKSDFVNFLFLPIIGYIVCLYFVKNGEKLNFDTRLFWIYSILIRIFVLFFPIGLSDDVYRYAWDGHLQQQGINPYKHYPDSSKLEEYRTSWWMLVNNSHIHTPYPPFAQILFFILTSFTSDLDVIIIIIRVTMTFFDLATIRILLSILEKMEISRERILIYAWSPLLILESSGNGHIDIIALFMLVCSFYFLLLGLEDRNLILSGICLGIGFMIKFFPIIALPFLLNYWRIKGTVAFSSTVFISTAIYIKPGINPLYPMGLQSFAEEFRFNESLFRLYEDLLERLEYFENPGKTARIHYVTFMIIISLILIYYYYSKINSDQISLTSNIRYSIDSYYYIILIALLTGPDIQPWYLLWLLPFIVINNDYVGLIYSITILFSYQIYVKYDATHVWSENTVILLLEYIPVYICLCYKILQKKFKKFEINVNMN